MLLDYHNHTKDPAEFPWTPHPVSPIVKHYNRAHCFQIFHSEQKRQWGAMIK